MSGGSASKKWRQEACKVTIVIYSVKGYKEIMYKAVILCNELYAMQGLSHNCRTTSLNTQFSFQVRSYNK